MLAIQPNISNNYQEVLPVIALELEAETFRLFDTRIFISRSTFILLKMKKDIKSAAVVESEAQTLETDKAASAAHDVHILTRPFLGSLFNKLLLLMFEGYTSTRKPTEETKCIQLRGILEI